MIIYKQVVSSLCEVNSRSEEQNWVATEQGSSIWIVHERVVDGSEAGQRARGLEIEGTVIVCAAWLS